MGAFGTLKPEQTRPQQVSGAARQQACGARATRLSPPASVLLEALRVHLSRSHRDALGQALARCVPEELPAAADRAYAAPLLYQVLRRYDLLAALPPLVGAALEAAALKNVARKAALQRTFDLVGEVLTAAGVEALALKGAALEYMVDAGPRVMSDLDLMLRRVDVPRAITALTGAGFRFDRPSRQCDSYQRRFYHLAPLLAPDGLSVVELHTAPWGSEIPFRCPDDWFWAGSRQAGSAAPSVRVPPWPCLMLHTAIHDSFVHPLNTRLRRCWDIALLLSAPHSPEDWEEAWRLGEESGAARVLAWTLAEADAAGIVDLPAAIGERSRRLAPRVFAAPESVSARNNRLAQALVRASLLDDPLQRARCLMRVALPSRDEVAVQVDGAGPAGYLRHLLRPRRFLAACGAIRELLKK